MVASGCATTRPVSDRRGNPVLLFQDATYDGVWLRGRVLVGASDGPVLVDVDMDEENGLTIDDVKTCDTGEKVRYWVQDSVCVENCEPRPPLLLYPGDWYGKEISRELFSRAPGPECFEFRLRLNLPGSQISEADAHLDLRVEKGAGLVPSTFPQ